MKTLLLLIALGLQIGCVLPMRRAKAAPPPAGPLPARIPDVITTSDNPPPPPTISQPPAVAVPVEDVSKVKVARSSTPLPPAPPRPRPRRTTAKPAEPIRVEEPAPPEPPTFRLREVLPPERREALLKQTDEMLTFCTKALAQVESRNLTNPQTRLAGRVRQFMQEAKDATESEPARARNMAARAKAFAEALLGELR